MRAKLENPKNRCFVKRPYLVSVPIIGLNSFVSSGMQCLFVDFDYYIDNGEYWQVVENVIKPYLLCGILIRTSLKKPFFRGKKIMWKDQPKYHLISFDIIPTEYVTRIMYKFVKLGLADSFHMSISRPPNQDLKFTEKKRDGRGKSVLRLSGKHNYDGGLKLVKIFDYGDEMNNIHAKFIDLYCRWLKTDKPQCLKYFNGKKRHLLYPTVTHTLYETKVKKHPFSLPKIVYYDLSLNHQHKLYKD